MGAKQQRRFFLSLMMPSSPGAGNAGRPLSPDRLLPVIRQPQPVRGSASVAWLALLLSLAALGLLFWQTGGSLLSAIAPGANAPVENSASVDTAAGPEAAAASAPVAAAAVDTEMQTRQHELSQRLARLEDQVPAALGDIEAARAAQQKLLEENRQLSAVIGQQLADTDALVLLDVEYLLAQATRELAVSANLQGPLSLLVAAHERAARAASPALAPLLDALEQDREQLQIAAERSVVQAADDLQRLAATLESLPMQDGRSLATLAGGQGGAAAPAGNAPAAEAAVSAANAQTSTPTTEPAASEDKWWQRLARSSAELVSLPDQASDQSLVRITEVGKHDLNLMPVGARYLIVQNLRLRLLGARLSLLMHDRAGFAADLKRASQWLAEHFDQTDARVPEALAMLQALAPMGEAGNQLSLARSTDALQSVRTTLSSASKGQS